MTAKEFLKGVKLKTETSGIKTDLEPTEGMEALLEDYHQAKLKLLGISVVTQAKRTVCPDCGDRGWIYDKEDEDFE